MELINNYPDEYFKDVFPDEFTDEQKEIVKKYWRENGLLSEDNRDNYDN